MYMAALHKDARFFVDGITTYLRREGAVGGSVIPRITALFDKVSSSAKGQKIAGVESAVPLTHGEKREIGVLLARLLHHDVELDCHVDTKAIGGFKIQVGDWVVDTTLRGQVDALQNSLNV